MNTARSNSNGTVGRGRQGRWLGYAVAALGVFFAASALGEKLESQEALIRRYPFDPACAFGRISNGKGMIVRCISEAEAEQLLKRTPVTRTPELPQPGAGGAPGSAPAPAPAGGTPEPAEPAPPLAAEDIQVTVGPIVADQGELSLSKLAQPKSRYAGCVADHGGLKDRSGEVHVRFLVRSKGIAEGVSVQKRVNVSAEAARCVSDIVDRRRVGVPDAPLVGATVIVKFDRTAP